MAGKNNNLRHPKLAIENSDEEHWAGIQPIEQGKQTPSPDARWLRFLRPSLPRGLKSGGDPGPPPDGGLKAWTQVAMAHLIIFNTWGFVNSFGVFQVSRQWTFLVLL